jgi:hypothetical protein
MKELSILKDNRELMAMLKTISGISAVNYPGNTLQIFILNIPNIVKNTWDMFKLAFPVSMTNLITILNDNYIDELKKIINIDNIPHYFGGNCHCKYPDNPRTNIYS